jgi:hypothetical protein
MVWEVDDEQARLYLATLNRLSGEDIPERRALLVGSLLESFDLDELAALLPEDRDQLAELERLVRAEPEPLPVSSKDHDDRDPRVILEFFLDQNCAKEVNLALDLMTHRHPNNADRSAALVQLARYYLGTGPVEELPAATHAAVAGDPDDG